MKFLMLLANDPEAWEDPGPGPGSDPDSQVIEDWLSYTAALEAAGVLVSGAALHPPDTSTSVRIRAGERLLTDGPFADTKEHLIGFYVVDVPDLDTAIAWAARVPNVRTGTVELRPLQAGTTTDEMLRATSVPR